MYHGFQPSNSFWPAELVQIAQIRIYMDQQEAVLSAPFHQQYTHKKKTCEQRSKPSVVPLYWLVAQDSRRL